MKLSTSDTTAEGTTSPAWKDSGVFGCVISGVLLTVVLFKLLSPQSGLPKVREVLQIEHQLAAEVTQLQAENDRIAADIVAMQTDPFHQEKIAREELNMALPGEIIYKFSE
jgi:cell division protein FtsB